MRIRDVRVAAGGVLEPLVALPVLAMLHAYGVGGTGPLWPIVLLIVAFGVLQQRAVLSRLDAIGRGPWLALTCHLLVVALLTYAIGWGPVTVLAFALVATHHMRRSGARLWRVAAVGTLVFTAAGQAAIALGWMSCYLPDRQAQAAGVLGGLLTALFIRILGVSGEQAEASEERFHALVRDASDGLCILDDQARATYMSPSIRQISGYDPSHYMGSDRTDMIHPDDREAFGAAWHLLVTDAAAEQTLNIRIRHANGGWHWVEATLRNMRRNPSIRGVVGTFRDVTERREIQERLRYDASHDQLTGLVNRAEFLRALEAADDPAVLFVDLDGFKPINDTHGHRFGDAVLIRSAERLRRAVTETDLVGRLGGDEFAIALTGPDAAARAESTAARLLDDIAVPFFEEGVTLCVRASVGIAVPSADVTGTMDLMHRADLAMYEAKRRGDHSAQVYRPAERTGAAP